MTARGLMVNLPGKPFYTYVRLGRLDKALV